MVIGITGATGFIGSALARAARDRGHEVVAYTRGKQASLPGADLVRPIHPDKEQALDPSGLDALVHLTGESVMGLWTPAKRRRIRDSRIDLTRRVVNALAECPDRPHTFLCGSAAGYYGDRGDDLLPETEKRGWGFLADVCAEWEREALRAATFGTRVVLLRTGVVLGRGGGPWTMLRRLFKLRLGSRLGNGRQWVPWIHIDDEIGIILDAIEKAVYRGPVNLAAPHPVTNAELTRRIADLLNVSTFIPVPAFAMKLVLRDMSSMVLDSLRLQPQVPLSHGYAFKYHELEHALAVCV